MKELMKLWLMIWILAIAYLMLGGAIDSIEEHAESCRIVRCT